MNGKIIITGHSYQSVFINILYVARYKSNGSLDSSFGMNGLTFGGSGSEGGWGTGVALQNDGKIISAGYLSFRKTFFNSYYSFILTRYNVNGSHDTTFGNYGSDTATIDNSSVANAMQLQNDGKIVAGGFSSDKYNGVNFNFALARFKTDGSLDSSFGISGNGKVITNFNSSADLAFAMKLFGHRIYLGGESNGNFTIAAYNNDTTALPVTFINFDGVLQNNFAVLTWSTANEINNKGFKVERSNDGITFTDIGFITGHENSGNISRYSYTDYKIISGSNYYRLKQIDLDGRFHYSSVIRLDLTKFDWAVSGNPAPNNTWMQLQLDQQANVSVQIISMKGNIIQTINKGLIQRGTYSIPLNLTNATLGMYVVRLIVDDKTYSKKIIK